MKVIIEEIQETKVSKFFKWLGIITSISAILISIVVLKSDQDNRLIAQRAYLAVTHWNVMQKSFIFGFKNSGITPATITSINIHLSIGSTTDSIDSPIKEEVYIPPNLETPYEMNVLMNQDQLSYIKKNISNQPKIILITSFYDYSKISHQLVSEFLASKENDDLLLSLVRQVEKK